MNPRAIAINLTAFALLAVVVLATYYLALDNDFLFEDRGAITRNESLHVSEFSLQKFWLAGTHALSNNSMIPSVTFAIDWLDSVDSLQPRENLNTVLKSSRMMLICSIIWQAYHFRSAIFLPPNSG